MATPQRKLQSHDIPAPAANDDRRPTPRVVVDNTKTQGQVPSTDEAWRREQASRTAAGQLTREEEQAGARPLPPFEEQNTQTEQPRPNKPFNVKVERKKEAEDKKAKAKKAAGTSMQATGVAMQGAGKGVKAAGTGVSAAGKALSRTGVGAVVGAPLIALGGTARGVGTGIDKTGKVVRRRGADIKQDAKRQERTARFGRQRKRLTRIRTEEGATKGIAKKAKLIRATWMASAAAFGLYVYQLGFWIIAIIGLGVEANLDGTGASFWVLVLQWVADLVIPGQELFAAGWLISSVLALWAMALALGAYLINAINPFRGNGMIIFGIVFALTLLPLGLIPWVYIWIFIVYREHTAKKVRGSR